MRKRADRIKRLIVFLMAASPAVKWGCFRCISEELGAIGKAPDVPDVEAPTGQSDNISPWEPPLSAPDVIYEDMVRTIETILRKFLGRGRNSGNMISRPCLVSPANGSLRPIRQIMWNQEARFGVIGGIRNRCGSNNPLKPRVPFPNPSSALKHRCWVWKDGTLDVRRIQ